MEGQAPSSSEEEEELTEEQLEEKRQVERLRIEPFIRASRLSSQQTPDDQTFMPRKPNQKRERERTKIAYMKGDEKRRGKLRSWAIDMGKCRLIFTACMSVQ